MKIKKIIDNILIIKSKCRKFQLRQSKILRIPFEEIVSQDNLQDEQEISSFFLMKIATILIWISFVKV